MIVSFLDTAQRGVFSSHKILLACGGNLHTTKVRLEKHICRQGEAGLLQLVLAAVQHVHGGHGQGVLVRDARDF